MLSGSPSAQGLPLFAQRPLPLPLVIMKSTGGSDPQWACLDPGLLHIPRFMIMGSHQWKWKWTNRIGKTVGSPGQSHSTFSARRVQDHACARNGDAPISLGNSSSLSSSPCAQFISASTYSGAGSFVAFLYRTPSSQRYSYLHARAGVSFDSGQKAPPSPAGQGRIRRRRRTVGRQT